MLADGEALLQVVPVFPHHFQADPDDQVFPAKVRENRIDAAVALMMAVGRMQASDADLQPDISAFLTDPLFA